MTAPAGRLRCPHTRSGIPGFVGEKASERPPTEWILRGGRPFISDNTGHSKIPGLAYGSGGLYARRPIRKPLLARLWEQKAFDGVRDKRTVPLLVLARPEIPPHNNPSESNLREWAKKRKISSRVQEPGVEQPRGNLVVHANATTLRGPRTRPTSGHEDAPGN